MRSLLLLMVLVPLAGCQWLTRMDETRRHDMAVADDRACRRAGHDWPAAGYMDCRRFRYDARMREQWQELQRARQQQQPEDGRRSGRAVDPYRRVRAENFRGEEIRDDGEPWIDCHER